MKKINFIFLLVCFLLSVIFPTTVLADEDKAAKFKIKSKLQKTEINSELPKELKTKTPKVFTTYTDEDGNEVELNSIVKHKLVKSGVDKDGKHFGIVETNIETPMELEITASSETGPGYDEDGTIYASINQHAKTWYYWICDNYPNGDYYIKWNKLGAYWERDDLRAYSLQNARFEARAVGVNYRTTGAMDEEWIQSPTWDPQWNTNYRTYDYSNTDGDYKNWDYCWNDDTMYKKREAGVKCSIYDSYGNKLTDLKTFVSPSQQPD